MNTWSWVQGSQGSRTICIIASWLMYIWSICTGLKSSSMNHLTRASLTNRNLDGCGYFHLKKLVTLIWSGESHDLKVKMLKNTFKHRDLVEVVSVERQHEARRRRRRHRRVLHSRRQRHPRRRRPVVPERRESAATAGGVKRPNQNHLQEQKLGHSGQSWIVWKPVSGSFSHFSFNNNHSFSIFFFKDNFKNKETLTKKIFFF